MLIISWSPYKENVQFTRSSRWHVCAYGSYVQSIAPTQTKLNCACSRWYDDWEQREWTASYVPAQQVSNTNFQITRSRSSWELARLMLIVQIQQLDIFLMSGVVMLWRLIPHVLFPWVPDDDAVFDLLGLSRIYFWGDNYRPPRLQSIILQNLLCLFDNFDTSA